MGERGVEIVGLESCVDDKFLVGVVVDGPHEGEAVDYHDDNHAYVIGESHEQTAEVVGLDHRLFAVEC